MVDGTPAGKLSKLNLKVRRSPRGVPGSVQISGSALMQKTLWHSVRLWHFGVLQIHSSEPLSEAPEAHWQLFTDLKLPMPPRRRTVTTC